MESIKKRRIAIVLVDRANYGRLKPVMMAIKQHPQLELIVICSGTMVLDRFDRPINVVRQDGYDVYAEIYIEFEGSTPSTMAKSLGFGIIEFSSEFSRINPDIVLVVGDRYESLAAALAASYMNLCLAHIQGGEVSGSIDESARHCISKLAQFHFPSTRRSAKFLIRMGELPKTVFHVGCPSGDIAKSLDKSLPEDIFDNGLGASIKYTAPYMLVVFHPVTTNFGSNGESVEEVLHACASIGNPTIWLWPNIDAGADRVSAAIRRFREKYNPDWLRLVKNFSPDDYQRVLCNASCAIGNSSSFVRDSSFFGTPIVLVGDRQKGREHAENVIKTSCEKHQIVTAISTQLRNGRYRSSSLYGAGNASERIAEHLTTLDIYVQKQLGYVST
jgi:UDP-hydrolysing UDP-N-acetyl-D-glucosamine 2-epimerase